MNMIYDPPKFVEKMKKHHYVIASIIFDVLFFVFWIQFALLLSNYIYLAVPVALIPLFHWLKMVKYIIDNNSICGYIVALLPSYQIATIMHKYYVFDPAVKDYANVFFVINVIIIATLFLIVEALIMYRFLKAALELSNWRRNIVRAAIAVGGLFFIILIYLPTDSYMTNNSEYNFAYQHLIWWSAVYFVLLTAFFSSFVAALKDKYFNVVYLIVVGLVAAVYAQYMFMNSRLDLLGTSEFRWEEHIDYAVFNAVIWLALLAAPFIAKKLMKDELWDRLSMVLTSAVTALHVVSYVLLLILAPERAYVYTETGYTFIADEQFTISSNKNTIVLVADAFDNQQLSRGLEEHPEWFDDFKDFTIYTDTCSVFDSTLPSMTQMFAGVEYDPSVTANEWFSQAWSGERATEFYKRLHDDNYVVNGYNFESHKYDLMSNCYDNLQEVTTDEMIPINIDTDGMKEQSLRLTLYRTLPFALKQFVDVSQINFSIIARYSDDTQMLYTNKDFLNALRSDLRASDSDKNYFVVQHFSGMHYPLLDENLGMQECFEVVRLYMQKLKELGVYDEATILLVADHGAHDSSFAPTPVFMIKEPYVSHNEYVINDSPIYHTDIMSTLLINAGLMERDSEEDKALFGASIYDFDENSVRERMWADRFTNDDYPRVRHAINLNFSGLYNVYHEYWYTGSTEDFDRFYQNASFKITPMTEFYG